MQSKHSTLKIETFKQDDMNDYILHNEKEIAAILRNIAQHRAQVALHHGENKSIISRVLSADETGIWIEASRNAAQNREIELSKHIVLVSAHNMVKLQWRANEAMQALYQESAAFFFPHPRKLLRLQRRDFYRLLCAPAHAIECAIFLPRAQKPGKHSFRVIDISIGGMALAIANDSQDLTEGAFYQDCEIELPELGTIRVGIRVRHIMERTTRSGALARRAGCSFINSGPEVTRLLQRYVSQAQQPANQPALETA